MSRIAYVNGRYLPLAYASVNIEDRGYQFSDGVYEVCEVKGGRLIDERRHIERLGRSLSELRIVMPMATESLGVIMREVVRRNRVRWGIVYLQITRGVSRRDHAFPPAGTRPSIVVTARNLDQANAEKLATEGVAVISVPENRWERVDIKSVSLLPNVLAKQTAREHGAREAWFVDKQGFVTEGSSSNAWIVTKNNTVVTRHVDQGILKGITRTVVLDIIAAQGFKLDVRPFTMDEAYQAKEAFITSASQTVMPVIKIDGRPVGNGAPGLLSTALRKDYYRHAEVG
ncbi:D-amino-acid transaminase [Rhodoplanes sp. Z2-YC6860]|uniref:D-amino-acid transaminase n=1 Tax=Rhodoplanes sp. Z2-YC6860 TaxID=674703 RepID=UPI00078CAE97|nr:D-amino-acid transaminase [Rhodoplanes sp. Z2-YC6860]AMN42402.1 class IV aminotransferase [Rhodoplanes sp. Z2-YC6860]